MTKDVMVTITGLHTMDEDDDAIEVVHIGEHYERNGAHYILFEERMEGMSAPVKNRIKTAVWKCRKKERLMLL